MGQSLRVTSFLPHLHGVKVETLTIADQSITLVAVTTRKRARCPLCQRRSNRIHSRYWRTIADQPWAGRPVAIRLRARRFFCLNQRCPRRIFAERLPDLVAAHGRRSRPLRAAIQRIGLALGARAGARLAGPLGMPISARSLLRLVHDAPLPARGVPRVIGLDDWAWRKGHRYGTVIVDLETNDPIDVLPDRAAETVVTWLQAHPSVAVIARDRGVMYVDGATRGAPDALQVVDRWHLAKNLGEALERLFAGKHAALTAAARDLALQDVARHAAAADAPPPAPVTAPRGSRSSRDRADSDNRRAARLERFMSVRNLSAQGLGQMAIAQTLGLSHHTVKRYLQAPVFPERKPRTARGGDLLDPYRPYLLQRWSEGCRNGLQLFREIQARGYASSRANVARFVTRLRRSEPAAPTPARTQPQRLLLPPVRPPAPRHLATLYLRRPDDLTDAQRALVRQVGQADTALAGAYDLSQSFMRLLRERRGADLDAWMAEVRHGEVPEVQAFAAGLDEDKAAVAAGLTLPWSTGPVEGTITRLKLLKRQAYGRAGTAFLRQRLLHAA
jgi:transposase